MKNNIQNYGKSELDSMTLNMLLILIRISTLRSIGLVTSKQTMKYSKEFEFDIQGNKLNYLEVWTNTQRTKGYKKINISKEINDYFFPILISKIER